MVKKINEMVDDLGFLMAQIAKLEKQANALKAELKAKGPGTYEGYVFQANISVSERDSLDMEAVRAKLTPQFIRAHTKSTEVVAVRVTARKEQLKAAA